MFNLYLAGSHQPLVEDYIMSKKMPRLFSAINDKSPISKYLETPLEDRGKLFVDSGAYSVVHAGKTLDLDAYINTINDNQGRAEVWAQLDDIPYPVIDYTTLSKSSEKSWENYVYMRERVVEKDKLLPVYHLGEPLDNFIRMLETEVCGLPTTYMGFGGRLGSGSGELRRYFDKMFNIIAKSNNPKIKVHAFGMTVLDLLEQFPFYSADSTSWLLCAAYGKIMTPWGHIIISDTSSFKPEQFNNLHPESKKMVSDYITSNGFDIEQLKSAYKFRSMFNVNFMHEWAVNYKYQKKIRRNSFDNL